jgi:hypothetical protein
MRTLIWISIALLSVACGDSDTQTTPSGSGTITFGQAIPPSGSTVRVTSGSPPGAFIVRGSGQIAIPLVIRSTRESPWAQLNVYLLTGSTDNYCGQNMPDSPTWGPFVARRNVQYTVTGFQVFRLPCDVTGIRAMLHLRQGGLLIPPTASETLAEGTLPITLHLIP